MSMTTLPPICLRPFTELDSQPTWKIFQDAVLNGTERHYSVAERHAWSSTPFVPEKWIERLLEQETVLGTLEGRIVGFMSMRNDGYIDLAFVAPSVARRGVGSQIYRLLEAEAEHVGLKRMFTEASLVARPFFEKHGWKQIAAQEVKRKGETLRNFLMEKSLA